MLTLKTKGKVPSEQKSKQRKGVIKGEVTTTRDQEKEEGGGQQSPRHRVSKCTAKGGGQKKERRGKKTRGKKPRLERQGECHQKRGRGLCADWNVTLMWKKGVTWRKKRTEGPQKHTNVLTKRIQFRKGGAPTPHGREIRKNLDSTGGPQNMTV